MKKTTLFLAMAFVLLFFSIAANNEFELLGDTQDYLAMAQSFIEGKPLQDPGSPFFSPLVFHPPLYPVFLAVFFSVFGFSYLGAKTVSVFFGVLSIIMFFFLLKKLAVKHSDLLLLAYSTSIVFLYQINRILSDSVFLTAAFIAIYYLVDFEKKEKTTDISGLISAVFLGLAFYARVAAVPLLVSAVIYFLLKKQWKKSLFIFLIFGLIVLPWGIFLVNYQFLQPLKHEPAETYINWATQTWDETQSGPAGIAFRFVYNIFYYVFEGIPKTIFPPLLPLFFFLRDSFAFPLLYLCTAPVFVFFSKTLWKEKKSLFGIYITAYILIFSIQPALDDVTFVDRYLLALFPFFLIFLSQALEKGFFAQKKLVRPVLAFIVLSGALLSLGYGFTLKDRMFNENYAGIKDSFGFIKGHVSREEIFVFSAPIHLYLNTNNKATRNPQIADDIGANYAIIDGWKRFNERNFENFSVVFESENKTSKVLKRTG